MALEYKEEVNELMNILKECTKKGYTEFLVKQKVDNWLSRTIEKYGTHYSEEDENV